MLNNTRLGFVVVLAMSMMLTFVGCGGVGSAPINGVGSLGQVAVSVSPQSMNITTGTTQPFTATVRNTSENGVGWLVNGFPGGINPSDGSSSFGTIDKNGNYTAPPFIPAPPTVTVTAVAMADNSATANASVSINGTPSPVSISPLSATLEVGRTVGGIEQLGGIALFTATVRNSSPAVNWFVEEVPGGNANLGTISPVPGSVAQVNYIAPQSIPGGGPQVHVTAQSAVNPQETASAVVTLLPVGSTVVAITEPNLPPTLQVGQTQKFQASVTGTSDTSVSWQVDGIAGGNSNVGTIMPGPNETALYTAPAQLPNPPQLIVTAVSDSQPAAQASMLVNVIPPVPVTVVVSAENCVNPNAVPINTTVQFSAVVTGASNPNVTWQVNKITGGNSAIGTITADGFYTAPAQLPTPTAVTVSAVSVADPSAVGNLPITISLSPVTVVQVSPSQASVQVNQSPPDFTATVLGLTDTAVVWDVNGIEGGDLGTVGQITWGQPVGCVTAAQYLAPAAFPTPNPVPVTAIASDGTTSAPIMVTVTAASQYVLHITPKGKVELVVGQTQPYTATEDGDANDLVTWSVSGQGCSGLACGTIVPPGPQPPPYAAKYTAPPNVPTPPNVTVTVSSVNHAGVKDTDEVVIQSTATPSISINPTFQSVAAGQNQLQFQATIQNYDSTATVVWELGCISDWDGGINQNCNDTDRDQDGPGCIQVQGGRQACGEAPAQGPANLPLTYTSPKNLFTTDFQANQCSGQSNDGTGYVELTVTLNAQGCPQGVCTANACVQVTP